MRWSLDIIVHMHTQSMRCRNSSPTINTFCNPSQLMSTRTWFSIQIKNLLPQMMISFLTRAQFVKNLKIKVSAGLRRILEFPVNMHIQSLKCMSSSTPLILIRRSPSSTVQKIPPKWLTKIWLIRFLHWEANFKLSKSRSILFNLT